MNTRKSWIFGLAGIGLACAAPVHASPDFHVDDVFLVAKREADREVRRDERDPRRDDRRAIRREAERAEPDGYGYGYERRQRQREEAEDSRQRGRR